MKLLIADDHAMFRTAVSDGLGVLLGAGTQVLEAEDYDGVHALLRANPDTEVVLLDLIMPGFANFDGLAALVRDFPAIPFLVVSGSSQSRYQVEAVRRGARGYIVKCQPLSVLAQIVRIVRDGGTYVSASALDPSTMVSSEAMDSLASLCSFAPASSRLIGAEALGDVLRLPNTSISILAPEHHHVLRPAADVRGRGAAIAQQTRSGASCLNGPAPSSPAWLVARPTSRSPATSASPTPP